MLEVELVQAQELLLQLIFLLPYEPLNHQVLVPNNQELPVVQAQEPLLELVLFLLVVNPELGQVPLPLPLLV